MYAEFLNDAVESQAQLVITPEYSLPWTLIEEIVQGGPRPPQGSLWVLGCESITFNDLDALRATASGNPEVCLIHEDIDPQQAAQKAFLDPLIFIFWTVNTTGTSVLCLLVQFKTVAARDPNHVELHSLYLGTCVYKFNSHTGDVSLIALICSDAFEFNNDLVDDHCSNLLLVHIQLTQKPAHVDYAAYRARLFSVASNNNVELVCLNWSRHVLLENSADPWNSIAGSAWYISPRGVTLTDDHVNQLHRDGMYYSIVGERWHCFYFDYAPHSVLLRKQPVFTTGPQVLAARVPPQVVARRAWNPQQGAWAIAPADDGFNAFIQQYDALRLMLPQLCGLDPLAVERALELLEGPNGRVSDWYTLLELSALKVSREESIRRVTVSQETDTARQGVKFRRRRARCAQSAATIPGQPVEWPKPVADLSGGFRFRWSNEEPHCNVEPLAGGIPAALVFLGDNVETDTLENIYAKLKKARSIFAFTVSQQAGIDPTDAVSFAQDRLCVVYRQNHTLQFYRPTEYASITAAEEVQVDDIAGA